MPNYLYKCQKCGKKFEAEQRITEDAFETCPESLCQMENWGKGEVSRVISKNVGLVFNGNGFYQTDYVNKKVSCGEKSEESGQTCACSADKKEKAETAA